MCALGIEATSANNPSTHSLPTSTDVVGELLELRVEEHPTIPLAYSYISRQPAKLRVSFQGLFPGVWQLRCQAWLATTSQTLEVFGNCIISFSAKKGCITVNEGAVGDVVFSFIEQQWNFCCVAYTDSWLASDYSRRVSKVTLCAYKPRISNLVSWKTGGESSMLAGTAL